mmetsp:Transcript_40733/g.85574  ORF Transcript_40733/g.85574 Transcript_40733/m.85574 type:complete len:295 (+) Transcript_40733:89-973(+)|eukprot:CAMPEP_0183738180 /NCGR_PEP_ID=MMETSP0737-20130205/53969_1 /TAXON_ID=385413 /ORGANISM="Thalassiosira miniscula, Strain CCMP1093" /LENGTH=294 /DNA_ID=CAMNT_0025972665 /DNA_START=37 /DNA_END=921 /DNA_ORIENTATION=-
MFGFRSYFGGGYGFDDWGPDRSGWAEKSDAALRRERAANDLFDAFLEKCAALDANDKSLFPFTEEVVKADTHLTGACYTSFRKRVMNKGCKVKRREATRSERQASGDTRKGKLYVISITCPVHPNKVADAKAAAAARKKKAQEAADRKAEKERKERQERERLAALQRAKVRDTYDSIVGSEEESKRKQTPQKSSGVDVESIALLSHAETVHDKRKSNIRVSIRKEQEDLMLELRRKHTKEENELRSKMIEKESLMMKEANAEYTVIQTKIKEACGEKTPHKAASKNFITPCEKR